MIFSILLSLFVLVIVWAFYRIKIKRALFPRSPSPQFLMMLIATILTVSLSACATDAGRPTVTIDPQYGVCVVSADGAYAACYNPATKGYTLKATVPGGVVKNLVYDSATKSYRGALPDGSTAVYKDGKLTFEPALPLSESTPRQEPRPTVAK